MTCRIIPRQDFSGTPSRHRYSPSGPLTRRSKMAAVSQRSRGSLEPSGSTGLVDALERAGGTTSTRIRATYISRPTLLTPSPKKQRRSHDSHNDQHQPDCSSGRVQPARLPPGSIRPGYARAQHNGQRTDATGPGLRDQPQIGHGG